MSMTKNEMESLKEEIERTTDEKSTNVRVRNDVYSLIKEHVKNKKISIVRFVTVAAIEKLIKDSK